MSKFTKALEQAEKDRERTDPVLSSPRPVDFERERTGEALVPIGESGEPPIELDLSALDQTLESFREIGGFAAERYRALRTCVEEAAVPGTPFVIAVTSPASRDGKTVTSLNLAGALAQGEDARVLLVDLDLRRGSIPAKLGIRKSLGVGIGDAIRDPRLSIRDIVRFLPQLNLSIVSPGRLEQTPYEMLRSPRLAELLTEAKRHFDTIVVDTPPLVPVADGRLIERIADRVIVVVACSRTPRRLLEEALRLLSPEKLLGFVFNDAQLEGASYDSGYAYAPPRAAKDEGGWPSRLAARLHLR